MELVAVDEPGPSPLRFTTVKALSLVRSLTGLYQTCEKRSQDVPVFSIELSERMSSRIQLFQKPGTSIRPKTVGTAERETINSIGVKPGLREIFICIPRSKKQSE
jgi:hypothetical protein